MFDDSSTSGQLALGINLRDDATFDNFLYSYANNDLKHALSMQLDNTGEQIVYLHGVDGSGRSHLLQAACHEAEHKGRRSLYLPMQEIVSKPGALVLEGLENLSLVCIDNVEVIAKNKQWEQELFHFINRARAVNCKLLFSASNVPGNIGIELADLRSRLAWGLVFKIFLLVDDEQAVALKMRALGRGLILSDEVVSYILSRSTRSLSSLLELLEILDRASMAEQRRLSIPFVRQYMDSILGKDE